MKKFIVFSLFVSILASCGGSDKGELVGVKGKKWHPEKPYGMTLVPGGAFIMVEKILGSGAAMDSAMVAEYYRHKANTGYDEDAIQRKRLALEGVLVPSTTSTHLENLRAVGFTKIDCFWRWMNFAGFIAVK